MAVIRSLERFEGRSSLKTWTFRILVNQAQSRGVRERRTIPFSSLAELDEEGATVDPDRFLGSGHSLTGYWSVTPSRFFELPEERLLAQETAGLVKQLIGHSTAYDAKHLGGQPPSAYVRAKHVTSSGGEHFIAIGQTVTLGKARAIQVHR